MNTPHTPTLLEVAQMAASSIKVDEIALMQAARDAIKAHQHEQSTLLAQRNELREALKQMTVLLEQVTSHSPVALPTTNHIIDQARAALASTGEGM